MVTCIILLVLAISCLVWGLTQKQDILLYVFAVLIILSFVVPIFISCAQPSITETIKEYQVCEYQGENFYIVDDRPYSIKDLSDVRISPDDKIHVRLVTRTTPKSIWYFRGLSEWIVAYIPLDCK